MDDYSKEELEMRFKELPTELREALTSAKMIMRVEEIARRHGLMLDETGEMAAEISLTMLGFHKPSEFMANLRRRIDKDDGVINALVSEINNEVFLPVREAMKGHDRAPSETQEIERENDQGAEMSKESLISAIEHPESLPSSAYDLHPAQEQEAEPATQEGEQDVALPDQEVNSMPMGDETLLPEEVENPIPIRKIADAPTTPPSMGESIYRQAQPTPAAPATPTEPRPTPPSTEDLMLQKLKAAMTKPASEQAPFKKDPYREPLQ